MGRRLNYEKTTNMRRTSYRSQSDFIKEVSYGRAESTDHMIKFNKFLVDLCNENGIDARTEDPNRFDVDRKALRKFNERLIKKLTEKGIRYGDLWKQKNRYKFDKDGNVIDKTTGKVVRRRDK